jgi:hypothetical protein
MSAAPGARIYNATGLTITNNTDTLLTFDTERYDVLAMHDASNSGRLTAPLAGVYLITATAAWTANATGTRRLIIYVNGSTAIASTNNLTSSASVTTRQSVSTLYYLNIGDYVTVNGFQTSGGDLDVVAAGNYSPEFAAQWVGA